jgi:hypothetical protein
MELLVVISVVVIIALFLIDRKLHRLTETLETNFSICNQKWDQVVPYRLHEFSGQLEQIKRKLNELTDVLTVDNPAWGGESASERKRDSLTRLYARHLVQQERMADEEALCKALFAVYHSGGDAIVGDMLSKTRREAKTKSEEDLRSADFFRKEVEEKAKVLKPTELFEPLYIGIKKKGYRKGARLSQRSHDSYSAEHGYKSFVEDAAIIYKLELLGLLKKDIEWARTGRCEYVLTETDLTVLRRAVFGGLEDSSSFDDAYFENMCSSFQARDIQLPFKEFLEP